MSNLTETSNSSDLINVIGVSDTVGNIIVAHLTKYAVTQVTQGLKQVIMTVSSTGVHIKYAIHNHRTNVIAQYKIDVKQSLALRYSKAIDDAEKNPLLRDDIKRQLIGEFERDLNELWQKVNEDFQRRI